ncbi:hypothetical protein [Paenibacillus campinasensis]|uniref:hypothetical protein n=1 Tax=Paenibacillus campinasensis TaxID=66347 RepID=UPI001FD22257|nr:hypothetical protein [Paenibacillus campinasensis]
MDRLNRQELEELGKLAAAEARKSAQKANTFFSYSENGKVIREYPDGRKTEVTYDERGQFKEIPTP